MSKQTAVDFAFQKLAKQGLLVTDDYKNLVAYREAKQMEKEQQESEQIELIKWMQDSLGAKEFYVAYEAEELLEKFKKK
jgi:hypothetical protein